MPGATALLARHAILQARRKEEADGAMAVSLNALWERADGPGEGSPSDVSQP